MATPLPFTRLVHCDWSVGSAKRWRADAVRDGRGWRLSAPRPVGPLAPFVAELLAPSPPLLAGFDMPIGLPGAFGARTGAPGLRALLPLLGRPGRWADFYRVNDSADGIALERPFFPDRGRAGMTARDLTDALGVASFDALRRACERAQPGRRAATPLFWTVGPAQVGKAAITGWRDVLVPALAGGAALWPFDGALADLAGRGPVLCETYPGEAYAHVGLRFGPRRSKRRQADRRAVLAGLPARLDAWGIVCDDPLAALIADGFGPAAAGEDAFDAVAGLLGMVEVADGRRPALPAAIVPGPWEGWILGGDGGMDAAMEQVA